MIVFTAIFGDYDTLHPHPNLPGVEWVAFTDNPAMDPNGWDLYIEAPRFDHPRLSAKWYRCHPPTDGKALWLDGSIRWRDVEYLIRIEEMLDRHDMVCLRHIYRDCVYDEVMASVPLEKYRGQPLGAQLDFLRRRHQPPKAGLWQTGILGFAAGPRPRIATAAWFAHNDILTYQDQLSFPYIVDLYGLNVGELPGGFWENPAFQYIHHHRED